MTVVWRPVDPATSFNDIVSALAREDCAFCGGTGIQPGDEYPMDWPPEVTLIHQRDHDRVCLCVPRFDDHGFGESVVIVRHQPPNATTYESVAYPRLNVEVLR